MKTRLLNLVLAIAFSASATWASNLSLSVQQDNGTNAITVAPGAVVNYKVVGTLSDNLNRGLGLVSVSLDFDLASPGGDLTPANSPTGAISCSNPMPAFDTPAGITNPPWPGGFGGTAVAGVLVQCCGAQNTIKNPNDGPGGAPEFPVGNVLLGVAQPAGCGPAVLLTGSLTIPMGTPNGTYNLMALTSGPNASFANTIANDGSGADFYTTEAVGAVTATNLAITVSGVVPRALVSSIPPFTGVGVGSAPTNGTLWRTAKNTIRLTFDGTLPSAPTAGQITIQELLPAAGCVGAGGFGPDLSANGFTFVLESGNTVLKVRDNDATSDLLHRKWYAIRNTGGWVGVAAFEAQFPVQVGDFNGDKFVTPQDVSLVNGAPGGAQADQSRADINGDGFKTPTDVSLTNGNQSGFLGKPCGH